jgi:hypothetical protein
MRATALTVLCLLLLVRAGDAQQNASSAAKDDASIRQRFVGNWRLVTFVNVDEAGAERDAGYEGGRIMYDAAGNMAAQLLRKSHENFIAYYGRVTIDPSNAKVTHHVEGSTQANWIGTDLVRYYEFTPEGRLKLSLRNSQGRVTGTLTWERLR